MVGGTTLKRRKQKGEISLKTKKRKALDQEAIAQGITPLEYMLSVIRAEPPKQMPGEPHFDFSQRLMGNVMLRLSAARYAAPYVHPRMAAQLKITADIAKDQPIDVLELAKKVAFLLTMAEHQQTIDTAPTMKQLQ